jgi:ppGpp synthetase/RelA/SpoT-type nucleotidyltranferase
MRADIEKIISDFKSISPVLKEIANKIETHLTQDVCSGIAHIDKVSSRPKSVESFRDKANKTEKSGKLKYQEPLKEIQDLIGARIVVYYKTDVDPIAAAVKKFFQTVEETKFVQDDTSKFGYEGLHFVCIIPNTIYSNKTTPLIPVFFELQIKTLYQHAWSQTEHGLGYKPGVSLSDEQKRKLAFIAAQSWGADTILEQLILSPQRLP